MIEMTREEMYEEFQVYCRNQLDSCDGCIFVRDKRCGNKYLSDKELARRVSMIHKQKVVMKESSEEWYQDLCGSIAALGCYSLSAEERHDTMVKALSILESLRNRCEKGDYHAENT